MLSHSKFLLLISLLFMVSLPLTTSLNPLVIGRLNQTAETMVYVDPPSFDDPDLTPSENISISVRISNVSDLYGFDIQLTWNASLLNYTGHQVKAPVESHPDGVLHAPILTVIDEVNATLGTSIFVYSSLMAPSSFNGTGTIVTMNFTIIAYGECNLTISNSDLSNRKGQAISHTIQNGYFSNLFYDVAVLSVVPFTNNAMIGAIVNITVSALNNGTMRNETFNVTLYYNSTQIESKQISALPPLETEILIFSWNTSGLSPGDYLVSANASTVQGETSIYNNWIEDGIITLALAPVHSVAVTGFTPLKTLAFKGSCFHVNATVENLGNLPEDLNLTLYSNNVPINETELHLEAGESITLSFVWELDDSIEYENYILNATIDQVIDDVNVSDNSQVISNVNISHIGDFDADTDVDIFDVVSIAQRYGSVIGDPLYHPNYDLDCDREIDIFDVTAMAAYYGYVGGS